MYLNSASFELSSSKVRMKFSPMILRLVSGSVTPASRPMKRSLASTATNLSPRRVPNTSANSSGSFLRIRPWSMNMHSN